jgi:phosphoglycerate dehydrogenase-like enzyme
LPDRIRTIHAYHAFGAALQQGFSARFPDRELVVLDDAEDFARGIESVEVLLALRPPRGHWQRARRLRLVQMPGAGVDSLLPAPDLPESVRIANARGIHEPEMAEFTLALILALAKRVPRAARQQARGEWKMYAGLRLEGATVGILGLGAIGHSVARRCKALGMRVIGTRYSAEPLEFVDQVLGPVDTRRVLEQSDVVVVVLPLTPETRWSIDTEALAAMKPRALLVNVARGGIVDEAALARALDDGRLGGAAVDVFEEEPLPESSPLWSAPNCLVTPHVAGLTRDYMSRVGGIFFENIRRLESGESLQNEIDRSRGY